MSCEGYAGGPDTESPPVDVRPQPFALKVHPDCAFLCDLHAHLADAEIIGLLGGRWDAGRNVMHVQAPFPCRAVARADGGATDVEMDPVSELQVREVMSIVFVVFVIESPDGIIKATTTANDDSTRTTTTVRKRGRGKA